ncbi:unnamed protein product, partial [marine sediment metagenome]
SNVFDTESFYFKFMNDSFNDCKLSAYIIEENGKPKGYFLIGMSFDNKVHAIITSQLSPPLTIKLLQHLNEYSKKEQDLNLNVAEFSEFGKYILSIGGKLQSNYGWQIKVPDLKRFFESIKVVLENRIEKSKFNNLSKTVIFSDYKQSIELIFNIGKLNEFYERVMMERGYLLTCLRGIPYYYRGFGYEFVLSLDERFSLSPNQIPSMELSHIDIRKASRKDIGYIENQYNSNSNNFLISNVFDTESFYFKFMNDS